jgi:hypothetical protein
MSQTITIRTSTRQDQAALRRLAELDSQPAPRGEALLAFVDGELRAALPQDQAPVADPFHRTLELIELLRAHASGAPRPLSRRPRAGHSLRLRIA